MLAYSTISHAGIILTGIGMLDGKSLAGAANLVLAHGLLKAGLFLTCGVILMELRAIDELRLHGAGRGMRAAGLLWLLATLGLVGIPYVGVFLGHSLEDDGAVLSGYGWLPAVVMVTAALSAGAMLRAGARVFLGWGPTEDDLLAPQPPEEPSEREAVVPLMLAVTSVAVALGLVVSVVPGLASRSEHAADQFRDRAAYAAHVLRGVETKRPSRPPFALERATWESVGYGIGSTVLPFAFAALGLWRQRLPDALRRRGARPAFAAVRALREVHSGIVGDYLLWLTVGVALIGGVWAFTLR
jgi:multicomponent Na+:H+ antiporter subunit D